MRICMEENRIITQGDKAGPLDASYYKGHGSRAGGERSSWQERTTGVTVVRRLTPTECERLQGFPGGWTDIPWKGKDHSPDSHRYKACGNSMAVPVMEWIGRRIETAEFDFLA